MYHRLQEVGDARGQLMPDATDADAGFMGDSGVPLQAPGQGEAGLSQSLQIAAWA